MIDTHQHFWRLSRGGYAWMPKDLPALYRDYEPHDLKEHLARAGIDGTITVQADDNIEETEFLLSLADQTPWILGVVGWVDLESPDAASEIARLAENPKFLGVRPMIQDIMDDEWMLKPELSPGLIELEKLDLSLDALILQKHLPVLDRFLDNHPGLRVVVDHCAKPVFKKDDFDQWANGIRKVAAHPSCYCKLSGLMTEAPIRTPDEVFFLYLDHAIDAFGPSRIVFGSDWPVLNLASDYARWAVIVRNFLRRHSNADEEMVFLKNALNAYPRVATSYPSGYRKR